MVTLGHTHACSNTDPNSNTNPILILLKVCARPTITF